MFYVLKVEKPLGISKLMLSWFILMWFSSIPQPKKLRLAAFPELKD